MQIQFHVDHYIYRAEFTGTIEIERLQSGNVACRKVSDDAQLKVWLDEEQMEADRKLLAEIRARSENWMQFLDRITQPPCV